jgi:hypothetical protein
MPGKRFAIFNDGQSLAIIRGNSARPMKGPDPAMYPHGVPEAFDFIYYSFGSMTTAGAAGIADRHRIARCSETRLFGTL